MRAGWPDVKTWRGYLKFRYQRSSRDEYPVLFLSLLILESNIYPGTRQNLNENRDGEERTGQGGKKLAFSPKHLFSNAVSITQVCFEKQLLSHTVLKHQLYIEDIDCVGMYLNKYMEIFYCQI